MPPSRRVARTRRSRMARSRAQEKDGCRRSRPLAQRAARQHIGNRRDQEHNLRSVHGKSRRQPANRFATDPRNFDRDLEAEAPGASPERLGQHHVRGSRKRHRQRWTGPGCCSRSSTGIGVFVPAGNDNFVGLTVGQSIPDTFFTDATNAVFNSLDINPTTMVASIVMPRRHAERQLSGRAASGQARRQVHARSENRDDFLRASLVDATDVEGTLHAYRLFQPDSTPP